MEFRVFDRWGGLVFHCSDNATGWDGTTGNGPAPSGVYVYTFSATMLSGKTLEMNGDLTLVR